MSKEYLDIIDESGRIIGQATRAECHTNSSLAHRTVHVLVFNSRGELFLQKRSINKDIQPGKWDTSVGGHLNLGETFHQAVQREIKEELGINAPVNIYTTTGCLVKLKLSMFILIYVFTTESSTAIQKKLKMGDSGPWRKLKLISEKGYSPPILSRSIKTICAG